MSDDNCDTELQEAYRTCRLLMDLGIFVLAADLIADAKDEQRNDEPFTWGLQRVENLYAGIYIDDHSHIPSLEDHAGQAFNSMDPTEYVWTRAMVEANRMLFADPAKPNRIIFDRYPRRDDALEQFVELLWLFRSANCMDDLQRAEDTRIWPILQWTL